MDALLLPDTLLARWQLLEMVDNLQCRKRGSSKMSQGIRMIQDSYNMITDDCLMHVAPTQETM